MEELLTTEHLSILFNVLLNMFWCKYTSSQNKVKKWDKSTIYLSILHVQSYPGDQLQLSMVKNSSEQVLSTTPKVSGDQTFWQNPFSDEPYWTKWL